MRAHHKPDKGVLARSFLMSAARGIAEWKIARSALPGNHIHDIEQIERHTPVPERKPVRERSQAGSPSGLRLSQQQHPGDYHAQGPRHPWMLHHDDFEAVPFQQTSQRLAREVMEVRRWMDHPPTPTSQPGVQAADVACCKGKDA